MTTEKDIVYAIEELVTCMLENAKDIVPMSIVEEAEQDLADKLRLWNFSAVRLF